MKRFGMFVCAAALMATGAYAGGGMVMSKLDANQDGKITVQEADAAHGARFVTLDLNKDNFIDASEAQKAKKDRWEKMKERRADAKGDGKPDGGKGMRGHQGGHGGDGMFERADLNNDGKVTKAEYLAASDGKFEDKDFNKDGVIEKSDMDAHRAACESGAVLCGPLAQADMNGDKKVSKAEFMAMPRPMFERMDSNKDGVIDGTEIAAAKKGHKHGPDGPPRL